MWYDDLLSDETHFCARRRPLDCADVEDELTEIIRDAEREEIGRNIISPLRFPESSRNLSDEY